MQTLGKGGVNEFYIRFNNRRLFWVRYGGSDDRREGRMTELEKANKTIEELLRINEELAGANGQEEKARLRIYELEAKLQKAIEEREKFRWKLIHREEVLKKAVKEAIREIVLHDEGWEDR